MVAASIHELPPETFLGIIDYLYWTKDGNPDYFGLRQYSLVCKLWSHFFQNELYKRVVLNTRRCVLSFQTALLPKVDKARSLRRAILYLNISVTPREEPFKEITPRDMEECLRLCPNLHELILSYDYDYLPLNLSHVFPPIKALRLNWSSEIDSRNFLLQLPSSLEFLDIWDASEHHQGPHPGFPFLKNNYSHIFEAPNATPPPFKLYELRWQACYSDSPVLPWVLSNSKESLQVMGLVTSPKDLTLWRDMMDGHGPMLRSLRIMQFHEDNDILEYALALRVCERLEEFAYSATDSALHPEILDALPLSLEHLKVTLLVKDKPFEDFIRLHERLRVITCAYWHISWLPQPSKNEEYGTTQKFFEGCRADGGIGLQFRDFRFTVGARKEVEPLVHSSRFPRQLTWGLPSFRS